MKLNAFQKIKYVNMFRKYLNEYGSAYSDSSRKFVEENFLKLTEPGETPDILVQLYAKFGMLSDSENIYLGFSKYVFEGYKEKRRVIYEDETHRFVDANKVGYLGYLDVKYALKYMRKKERGKR